MFHIYYLNIECTVNISMDISRDHLGSRVYMTGSQYVTKKSRWHPRWPPNVTDKVLIYCLILALCPYIVPYVSLCNLVGDHLRCKEIKGIHHFESRSISWNSRWRPRWSPYLYNILFNL